MEEPKPTTFTISKSYEENIIIGQFRSAKIGITIRSSKQITSKELSEYSKNLGNTAQRLVKEELSKLRETEVVK